MSFLSNSAIFGIAPPWEWPGKAIEWVGNKAGGEVFTFFLNIIHDAFNSVVKAFETQYVNAASVNLQGTVVDYFFGSALGLARYVAWTGLLVGVLLVVIPGGGRFFVRAVKVAFFVMLAPIYFIILDWLPPFQSAMAHAAVGMYTPTGEHAHVPLLLIPIADNPLFALMGMGWVVGWGGLLLLMFKGYALIGLVASLLLLPFFALSALWDWALKFMNVLISTIIVTKIAGIPLALFVMKLAEAITQNVPGLGDSLGLTIVIGFALFVAWALQFLLFWACLKVVSPVTGKVYSRGKSKAQVEGKVKAETTEKRRTQRRNQGYSLAFLDRRPSHGREIGQADRSKSGKHRAVTAGATLLAKRYPQTAVALKTASVINKVRSRNGGSAPTTGSETRTIVSQNGMTHLIDSSGPSGTQNGTGDQPRSPRPRS